MDEFDALITRAQQHDTAALDALVDAYSPRLYGFLYRLTSRRHDAEDLVQEVFVRLVRTIGGYQHNGKFEAWLFRIAANLARDRVRKITRTPASTSLDSPAADGGPGPDDWMPTETGSAALPGNRLEQAEVSDSLQAALAKLPPAEREVIMLRHYSDLSFAEIADLMGTPLGTALARSHRALQKLREMMEGDTP